MKRVFIQQNDFKYHDLPTTQEDNHHEIKNRYKLFQKDVAVGHMAEYFDGTFAIFIGNGMRFDFSKKDVTFIV